MEKSQSHSISRRDFLKVALLTFSSALSLKYLTSCDVSVPQNTDPDVIKTPKGISTKTVKENQAIHDEIAKSFLETHPEFEGREMGNLAFSINGVVSDTIIISANEAEQEEINSFKNTFNGIELQPYDKAVVFTQKTSPDGSTEWVRLSGVWFPTEDGTVNTAWYYSPDAFNKDKEPIEFNQKVFAFNSEDPTYLFWPIMNPPNKLLWSADLTSTDPNDYKEWDGMEPFIWSMSSDIKNGIGKALFAPMTEVEGSRIQESNNIILETPAAWADKLKLNTENTAELNHYILETLSLINWQTVEAVIEEDTGEKMSLVIDGKINPEAWEAWKTYLDKNDGVLKNHPEFLIMNGMGGDSFTLKLTEVGKEISLNEFKFNLVTKDQYIDSYTNSTPEIAKRNNRLFVLYPGLPMGGIVQGSMETVSDDKTKNNIITFSLINKRDYPENFGFPKAGKSPDLGNTEIMDESLRLLLYMLRCQQNSIPTGASELTPSYNRSYGDDNLVVDHIRGGGTSPLYPNIVTNSIEALKDLSKAGLNPALTDLPPQIFEY